MFEDNKITGMDKLIKETDRMTDKELK